MGALLPGNSQFVSLFFCETFSKTQNRQIIEHMQINKHDWRLKKFPFLCCWMFPGSTQLKNMCVSSCAADASLEVSRRWNSISLNDAWGRIWQADFPCTASTSWFRTIYLAIPDPTSIPHTVFCVFFECCFPSFTAACFVYHFCGSDLLPSNSRSWSLRKGK